MPFSQGFLPRHRTLGKLSEPTYRSLAQVVLLDQLGHLPLIWSKQPAHGDHHRLIQLLFLERREHSIALPVRWGFEAGSASLTERMQGSLEIPSRKHFSNECASGLNLPFFQGVRGGNSWFQYHLTLIAVWTSVDVICPASSFPRGAAPSRSVWLRWGCHTIGGAAPQGWSRTPPGPMQCSPGTRVYRRKQPCQACLVPLHSWCFKNLL